MAAVYADVDDLDKHIADILNASATWAGAITAGNRSSDAIANARQESALEVLGAIAMNPNHGYFGELSALVAHAYVDGENDVVLAAHDGEVGVPKIVPFADAIPRDGIWADPDQIDAWRQETEDRPRFTGALDGRGKPHSVADANGNMSPLACRYSIVSSRLKFTGYSCLVPMIIITTTMRDTKIPIRLGPAVVKLSIPKLVKPGDVLYQIAGAYGAEGQRDRVEVASGAMSVRPVRAVPDIVAALR